MWLGRSAQLPSRSYRCYYRTWDPLQLEATKMWLYWPSSNKDCENTPWLNHSNETFMALPHVESFKVIQQQLRDATASVIHKTHVSRVEMASRAIFVTNEIYNIVFQPAQRVHVSQFKTTHKMQAFRNGQAKRGIYKYVCEHQSSSM